MKKVILGIAVVTGLVACNSNKPADEEVIDAKDAQEVNEASAEAVSYAVVTEGDEINWKGYKIIGSDNHVGTMQVSEGELTVENGALTGGKVVIDMTSIKNTDLPAEGDYGQATLEGHLKSPDFFLVDSFPKAVFTITSVSEEMNDSTEATHNVEGNLMLRGVEKSINFPATIAVNENGLIFAASNFTIDRTQWGVNYSSSASLEEIAKDKLIDDNITLSVSLEAK